MAVVLADNPFAKKYPPLTRPAGILNGFQETGKDGEFSFVGIPGRVMLTVRIERVDRFKLVEPDPKYPELFTERGGFQSYSTFGGGIMPVQGVWCQVIEAKESETELTVNVELEPAPKTL